MTPLDYAAVGLAGVLAGAVNTLAGAGSLLTYPVLVAVGLPPLAANVTNDIGVLPGNISGAVGLRKALLGRRALLRQLLPGAVVGSLLGAALLLIAPASSFGWAAPPLILAASVLTLFQPMLTRRTHPASRSRRGLHAAVDAVAVYGGYFGTGMGLLFLAALGLFVDDTTRHLNATKNVLQALSNGLAGVVFAFVAPVHWLAATVMAGGSLLGGQAGAWASGRIPSSALRVAAAAIGIAASGWLFAREL